MYEIIDLEHTYDKYLILLVKSGMTHRRVGHHHGVQERSIYDVEENQPAKSYLKQSKVILSVHIKNSKK
jgi:hypothetical protein